VKKFTDSDFLTGIALMIGDGALDGNGCTLWKSERLRRKKNRRTSIVTIPDFEHYCMPYWRFKQFRKIVPVIWEDKSKQETDEWWRFISALDEFNERRKTVVTASAKKVASKSMLALRTRTTKRGGLPHLSFILRKPEPLGTEFKNTCFGRT
jgi:hypothetical protein